MAQAALKTEQASPHGSTGASHPAIIKALAVYGKDWGEHSESEQVFLKALRAADKRMIAATERAGRAYGYGAGTWTFYKEEAERKRDVEYANALRAFEAAETEDA